MIKRNIKKNNKIKTNPKKRKRGEPREGREGEKELHRNLQFVCDL